MSGAIKRALGPMMKRLSDSDQMLNSIMKREVYTNEEKELLKQKEDGFRKLISDIERKNENWIVYIQSLTADEKEKEEKKYDEYQVSGKHFYEWVDSAKVTMDNLRIVNRFDDSDDDGEKSSNSSRSNKSRTRNTTVEHELQVFMPKLKLPEFRGDPHEWQSFWQSFESSVHNRCYKGIDKMKFLMMCLFGEAKDAISDIKLSNENYEIALGILKKRFGDKDVLIESLEADLLQLQPARDPGMSLKRTVDQIEKICRQLKALNKDVDNESVWTSVIKSKLPTIVRLELAKSEKSGKKKWSTSELREALVDFVSTRELVFTSMKHFKRENLERSSFQNNDGNNYQPRNSQKKQEDFVQSFQVVANSNQRNINIPDCLFCDEKHWAIRCINVVCPEDRMERLSDQKRCFLCLKLGHRIQECEATRNCQICNGRHHTAICRRSQSGNDQNRTQGNSYVQVQFQPPAESKVVNHPKKEQSWSRKGPQIEKSKNIVQSQMQIGYEKDEISEVLEKNEIERTSSHLNIQGVQKPGDTILMAQKVPIFAPNCPGKVFEALVFFDTGSQTSYIQKSLVQKLNPPKVGDGILEVQGFQSLNPVRFRSSQYVINLRTRNDKSEQLILFSTEKFTHGFKAVCVGNISDKPTLSEVKRNMEFLHQEPDILIGIPDFWKFFVNRHELTPEFYLIETTIGPIVCGRLDQEPEENLWKVQSNMMISQNQSEAETLLNTWWDLQSIGIKDDPKVKKVCNREKNEFSHREKEKKMSKDDYTEEANEEEI